MYKLLIVDDEPLIRKGIIKLIDYKELAVDSVYEAADGRSALKIVRDESPDIVLADINMPVMDGLEFSSRAKKIKPEIKIAIITGYDYFDYAVAALKAGVDDFVLKPVSRDDIQKLLNKMVHELNKEKNDSGVSDSIELLTGIKEKSGADSEYRQEIMGIIDHEYSNPSFSLKSLARSIALSPGYLSTLFKDIFGITFHDYLTAVRLERAKILVLSSSLKNYEIAEQVGFEDPNYFSTAFKRRFGLSPSKYRNSTGERT